MYRLFTVGDPEHFFEEQHTRLFQNLKKNSPILTACIRRNPIQDGPFRGCLFTGEKMSLTKISHT